MGDENQAQQGATATATSGAEAAKPVGPTIEQFQAEIEAWQVKYKKEVGDRDRGNARLATEVERLKKSTDSLARRTLDAGEPPDEETEYQKWKKEPSDASPENPSQSVFTSDQILASGRMMAIAEEYEIDWLKPPADISPLLQEVNGLYTDNPLEAAKVWKEGLKKRAAGRKAKAEADAKAKKEEAEKRAKSGTRDTSTSTGGAQGSYEVIRDAWIKNPNDPGTRAAYLEARRARGV